MEKGLNAVKANENRRRFPRRQFKGAVGVLVGGHYEVSAAQEIGEGGLLFTSSKKISNGTFIVANFFVPGRNFVTVKAEVVYQIGDVSKADFCQYGLKFHNLSFEARRMIRDYIAEKTVSEFDVLT